MKTEHKLSLLYPAPTPPIEHNLNYNLLWPLAGFRMLNVKKNNDMYAAFKGLLL